MKKIMVLIKNYSVFLMAIFSMCIAFIISMTISSNYEQICYAEYNSNTIATLQEDSSGEIYQYSSWTALTSSANSLTGIANIVIVKDFIVTTSTEITNTWVISAEQKADETFYGIVLNTSNSNIYSMFEVAGGGSLTIKSGIFDAKKHTVINNISENNVRIEGGRFLSCDKDAIVNCNKGSISFLNGTIDVTLTSVDNDYYAILNYGKNRYGFDNQYYDGHIEIGGGLINGSVCNGDESDPSVLCTMTVSGGTINGGLLQASADETPLIISDGTISYITNSMYKDYCNITMTGGTVNNYFKCTNACNININKAYGKTLTIGRLDLPIWDTNFGKEYEINISGATIGGPGQMETAISFLGHGDLNISSCNVFAYYSCMSCSSAGNVNIENSKFETTYSYNNNTYNAIGFYSTTLFNESQNSPTIIIKNTDISSKETNGICFDTGGVLTIEGGEIKSQRKSALIAKGRGNVAFNYGAKLCSGVAENGEESAIFGTNTIVLSGTGSCVFNNAVVDCISKYDQAYEIQQNAKGSIYISAPMVRESSFSVIFNGGVYKHSNNMPVVYNESGRSIKITGGSFSTQNAYSIYSVPKNVNGIGDFLIKQEIGKTVLLENNSQYITTLFCGNASLIIDSGEITNHYESDQEETAFSINYSTTNGLLQVKNGNLGSIVSSTKLDISEYVGEKIRFTFNGSENKQVAVIGMEDANNCTQIEFVDQYCGYYPSSYMDNNESKQCYRFAKAYPIQYSYSAGCELDEDSPTTFNYCTTTPLLGAKRNGYDFVGWSDGTNVLQSIVAFTEEQSITLTAVWRAKQYKVILSSNGGTIDGEFYISYDTNVVKLGKRPYKKGYYAIGYYFTPDSTEMIVSKDFQMQDVTYENILNHGYWKDYSGDVALCAHWEENCQLITFTPQNDASLPDIKISNNEKVFDPNMTIKVENKLNVDMNETKEYIQGQKILVRAKIGLELYGEKVGNIPSCKYELDITDSKKKNMKVIVLDPETKEVITTDFTYENGIISFDSDISEMIILVTCDNDKNFSMIAMVGIIVLVATAVIVTPLVIIISKKRKRFR